jgi:hypothetical protein
LLPLRRNSASTGSVALEPHHEFTKGANRARCVHLNKTALAAATDLSESRQTPSVPNEKFGTNETGAASNEKKALQREIAAAAPTLVPQQFRYELCVQDTREYGRLQLAESAAWHRRLETLLKPSWVLVLFARRQRALNAGSIETITPQRFAEFPLGEGVQESFGPRRRIDVGELTVSLYHPAHESAGDEPIRNHGICCANRGIGRDHVHRQGTRVFGILSQRHHRNRIRVTPSEHGIRVDVGTLRW